MFVDFKIVGSSGRVISVRPSAVAYVLEDTPTQSRISMTGEATNFHVEGGRAEVVAKLTPPPMPRGFVRSC